MEHQRTTWTMNWKLELYRGYVETVEFHENTGPYIGAPAISQVPIRATVKIRLSEEPSIVDKG